MKRVFLLFSFVVLVAVAVFAVWARFGMPETQHNGNRNSPPLAAAPITVFSPKSGDTVVSPVKITGEVTGNGWSGFEGQVGTVRLVDNKGKELARGVLKATTEWTSLPTMFESTLTFSHAGSETGQLVFHNENPSGMPEKDAVVTLPVMLGEMTPVKVFFGNTTFDPQVSCNKVFAVTRQVPKTQAVARAAVEQLLGGVTDAEKSQGYFTSINDGVVIQSLTIANGVARIDFNSQLDKNAGGSCRVATIRAEITQTLLQFSTVKSVIISENGVTDTILQP